MLEKDREVGYPVRCGEAISRAGVEEFIDSNEDWIKAHITKFSFVAPDDTEVLLKFDEKDEKTADTLRKSGFTARLLAPADGIIKGRSVLVATHDEPHRRVLHSDVALHVRSHEQELLISLLRIRLFLSFDP